MASVIAAQLYTLREFTKTPADIASTFAKVRKIGYEAVQCSGLGPIEPKELARIAKDSGLKICATHVGFDRLNLETKAAAEDHILWGCKHPAVGSMPGSYRTGEEGYIRFAKDASEVARKLSGYGLTFSYHNHSFEFQRHNGRVGMDILLEASDPLLKFELDTYWVQHGGGSPEAWIRKMRGRMPLLHLKDMAMGEDKLPYYAEVGEGNLNWPGILAAAREIGVEWYIVEQDLCRRDPFESLKISLENLRRFGLE